MPLYEYHCINCGKSCEILQKMNETPAITCPHCGKDQLHRQISAPHFQLKGSGWYVTDFKNKTSTPTSTESDSGSTSSESPSSSGESTQPDTSTKDKDS